MPETRIKGINIGDATVTEADISLASASVIATPLAAHSFVMWDTANAVLKTSPLANVEDYFDTKYSILGHTHAYLPLAGGTMANTNLVINLNADLLEGQHGSYYATADHVHENALMLVPFTNQTVIVVTHNYATYPIVQVLDGANAQIIPMSIVHTSLNQVTITFSVATSGIIQVSSVIAMPQASISAETALALSINL